MAPHGSTVHIIGAGIFGVTAALELKRRGYAVALFGPGPLPHPLAASTDITKMIRMDYGTDAFYTELMEECFLGWDRWNRDWGEDLYHQTGSLVLAAEPFRPGGFEHDSYQLLRQRGHAVELLDSAELHRRFPAWTAERYAQGYFNPRGGWAESGRVVARLLDETARAGVEIHTDVTCARLVVPAAAPRGVPAAGFRALGGGRRQHRVVWVHCPGRWNTQDRQPRTREEDACGRFARSDG